MIASYLLLSYINSRKWRYIKRLKKKCKKNITIILAILKVISLIIDFFSLYWYVLIKNEYNNWKFTKLFLA